VVAEAAAAVVEAAAVVAGALESADDGQPQAFFQLATWPSMVAVTQSPQPRF